MSSSVIAVRERGHVVAENEVDDLELVNRTQNGDSEAFSELVRRHQHVVYNVAYRYVRDVTLAEDMAQEAFVKAFRLIKGFRGDCSFATWMYRVTTSVCLTELSRRKKRGEVALTDQHLGAAETPDTDTCDMPEHIRRSVAKLSDRYATIITLYYLKGISYEEIAQVLEIPMGTLKTWMFRARKQLRKIVERDVLAHE